MCIWTDLEQSNSDWAGQYETTCDNMFLFSEGDPDANGFNFCPFCGERIEQFKGESPE